MMAFPKIAWSHFKLSYLLTEISNQVYALPLKFVDVILDYCHSSTGLSYYTFKVKTEHLLIAIEGQTSNFNQMNLE